MTRPGGLAWFGATLVWIGAAVMSFAGLDGLARSCYIQPAIAWLLPIVIDVGVAVAAWVWRRGVNPGAAKLAGRLTWSLLVLTVLGNGAHLGMESSHVLPPWWVAALVGAVPPAVAGAVAHLLVLLGRSPEVVTPAQPEIAQDNSKLLQAAPNLGATPPSSPPDSGGQGGATGAVYPPPAPVAPQTPKATPDAARLIAAGAGRRKLSRELNITEHEARTLLEQAKTNGHKVLEEAR